MRNTAKYTLKQRINFHCGVWVKWCVETASSGGAAARWSGPSSVWRASTRSRADPTVLPNEQPHTSWKNSKRISIPIFHHHIGARFLWFDSSHNVERAWSDFFMTDSAVSVSGKLLNCYSTSEVRSRTLPEWAEWKCNWKEAMRIINQQQGLSAGKLSVQRRTALTFMLSSIHFLFSLLNKRTHRVGKQQRTSFKSSSSIHTNLGFHQDKSKARGR